MPKSVNAILMNVIDHMEGMINSMLKDGGFYSEKAQIHRHVLAGFLESLTLEERHEFFGNLHNSRDIMLSIKKEVPGENRYCYDERYDSSAFWVNCSSEDLKSILASLGDAWDGIVKIHN